MALNLSKNLKTTEHNFTVRLAPAIFQDKCEIHGVAIAKREYHDKLPENGEPEQSESFDNSIKCVGLTSKGQPDKRVKPDWSYGGEVSCVFSHALVQLLEPEQRALFRDVFREKAIRLNLRMERLIDRDADQSQIDSLREEIAKTFDENVVEAMRIIQENAQ